MTDCLPCTPGYYCLEAGKANVTDECDAGYYCHGGAEEQNPTGKLMFNMIFTIIQYGIGVPLSINLPWFYMFKYFTDGTTGDICPIGHYCPRGSPAPIRCGNATYMNHTGAAECYVCPAGYYCTDGTNAELCPQGYYCPVGTGFEVIPCPVGM